MRRWRGLARRPVRQSHCCARQQRSVHRCLCCQRWMAQKDLRMLCSPGQRLALTGCKLAPYENYAGVCLEHVATHCSSGMQHALFAGRHTTA